MVVEVVLVVVVVVMVALTTAETWGDGPAGEVGGRRVTRRMSHVRPSDHR